MHRLAHPLMNHRTMSRKATRPRLICPPQRPLVKARPGESAAPCEMHKVLEVGVDPRRQHNLALHG
jgi:hypothetical protein